MRTSFGIVIFLVALSTLVVTGQEPPLPEPPGGGAAARPESDPAATKILATAIAHQGPEVYSRPGAIKDLTVRIQCQIWDHTRTPPQRLSLGVRRYLVVEPERFRSEWTTVDDTQIQGFDGRRYWYQDKNGAQFLLGDDKKESREEVRKEIDETRYLLRFFFLANLQAPTARFTVAPDETQKVWGKSLTCRVVKRDNLDPESSEPPVTLYIDAESGSLVKATAHATTYGQKSLSFIFQYSEAVQPRVKGVLFPFRIEVREQPFGAEKDRLSLYANLEERGGIEFNTGLPNEIFLRPR